MFNYPLVGCGRSSHLEIVGEREPLLKRAFGMMIGYWSHAWGRRRIDRRISQSDWTQRHQLRDGRCWVYITKIRQPLGLRGKIWAIWWKDICNERSFQIPDGSLYVKVIEAAKIRGDESEEIYSERSISWQLLFRMMIKVLHQIPPPVHPQTYMTHSISPSSLRMSGNVSSIST